MGHEWSTGGLVFARCVRCGAWLHKDNRVPTEWLVRNPHTGFDTTVFVEPPCIDDMWDALIAEASR